MMLFIYVMLVSSSICCISSQYLDPIGYGNLQGQQQQVQYAPGIQQGIPYFAPYPYQSAVGNLPVQQQQQLQPQLNVQPDQYSNVKTEIIDVNPSVFRQLMSKYNFQPKIVSYESNRSRVKPSFGYVIRTGGEKSNQTILPNNMNRHEVNQNVYTFNKTFVLHPDGEKDQELNLNFVNGVQVTDAPEQMADRTSKGVDGDEGVVTTVTTVRSSDLSTTTESETPSDTNSWFF